MFLSSTRMPILVQFVLLVLLMAEPSAAAIKVACIGDSITEGSGLSNPSTESYPAKLRRLLGTTYEVRNYGVSGRTLLKQGDFPYWKEPQFKQSHDFNPDIVTIMLGTNDAKPQNWRYGSNYTGNLTELIESYSVLPSHPRILLCTPPPVYGTGAFDIRPGTVATNVTPAVLNLASQLKLEVIHLHDWLANHREWFPDTVHPNTRGTTVMAALFHSALVPPTPNPGAPLLQFTRPFPGRAVAAWPATAAGWILQSAPVLPASGLINWTVVEIPAWNDDSFVRVTNTTPGAGKLFRLWHPPS